MAAVLSAALGTGAVGSTAAMTLAPFLSISVLRLSVDATVIKLKLEIRSLKSDYVTFILPEESPLRILSTEPIIIFYKASIYLVSLFYVVILATLLAVEASIVVTSIELRISVLTFLSAAASSSIYSGVLAGVDGSGVPVTTVTTVTLKAKKSRDYNLSSVEAASQPPD